MMLDHAVSSRYDLPICAGGSAGIGKATALKSDTNGCQVAVLGRRHREIGSYGRIVISTTLQKQSILTVLACWAPPHVQVKQMRHVHAIVAVLTKEGDMTRAIEEAVATMGGLEILVNR